MGFQEECFRESIDEMIDGALDSENPWLTGISRESLERKPSVRLNFGATAARIASAEAELRSAGQPLRLRSGQAKATVPTHSEICSEVSASTAQAFLPFAHGGFRTPSGKALLYNDALIGDGLDPVADFRPSGESRNGLGKNSYPLELLARKHDNYLNSSFSNLPSVQEMETSGLLEMHASDAQSRGISDGDRVRVFNGRGEVTLKARVDGTVQPGLVAARLNWVKTTPGFQSINSLTSEKLADMGNSATFYSVLVEVELSKPSP
jgi:anaerobic selenocysteine-containing dehydrogenase